MPGDPGELVVTNACAFYHYTRGCGRIGRPAFPTPFGRNETVKDSGASRRGNVEAYSAVIASEAKQSNPSFARQAEKMDCFVVSLLAMTV
jgi:hypothetical protein